MTNTYNYFANLTRSSKLVLCHIEPKQRHSVFTLHSGSVYKKSVNHFVVDVFENGTSMTAGSNTTLSAGAWWYDAETSVLYVRMSDSSDPKTKTVISTYRLFFSNRPIDLQYDLDTGSDVHYNGRIRSTSPIRKELDDEQIGVAIETSTNIVFENTDGYFDDIYDTLIFENKDIKVWSWHENLPISEKQKIFDGVIQNKSFSESSVSFSCKDFSYKLREPVSTTNFTTSDGDVPDSYLNTPKRRLFGQFNKLRCVPIDAVNDGFSLTGSISGAFGDTAITGSGTSFLSELSPEDELIYETDTTIYKLTVSSIASDTSLTITNALEISISSASTIKVNPKYNYRGKNRRWHIAGHKLMSPNSIVSNPIDERRFEVVDIGNFQVGDLITVDGENAYIKRISSSKITLETNLQSGAPTLLDSVVRNPLSYAYINGVRIFIDRDWTVTNTTSDCILVLDNLAEFNLAPTVDIQYDLTFTNGTRTITVSGVDMNTELKPRDWIRSDDITHTTWYEVLSVVYDNDTSTSTITTRTTYAGGTTTTNAQKKNVDVVTENSIITVDCLGQDRSGAWVKTASDAVKDMLQNDIGITNIDSSSFADADFDSPFTLSYAIPKNIGGSVVSVRDAISDINKSVFGSLVTDNSFNLKYQILTCETPDDISKIEDHDLSSPGIQVSSKSEIIRKVNGRYGHFVDGFNGNDAYKLYEYTNEFVDDIIGVKSEMDIDIYLYKLSDVRTIVQRYCLYNSLSQARIKLKGKLNLYSYILNSKVFLGLDRLYKRFGNPSRLKVGIVHSVSNNGSDIEIEINDLGNAFNRTAKISPTGTVDYSSATDDEIAKYSWICDTDTETPSIVSDESIFTQIIN